MATPQQKAQCVIWLIETKSIITVQRNFRRIYRANPPTDKSIRRWLNSFKETGSVLKQKSPGRPCVSEECVERIRAAYLRNPKKSLTRHSLELGLARSTVHKYVAAPVEDNKPYKKKTKVGKEYNHSNAVAGSESIVGYNQPMETVEGDGTVYIKQEILESNMDVGEGTSSESMTDPLATDDLHSQSETVKVENIKTEITTPEDMCLGNIKTEVLELSDVHEEGFSEWGCEECSEEFAERLDLERHMLDRHSDSDQYLLKEEPKILPALKKIATERKKTTAEISGDIKTTQSSSSTTTNPQQLFVLYPSQSESQPPMLLPHNPLPAASASVPTSNMQNEPSTALPCCAIDASAGFYISLARFPQSMRVALKKKMLEVITTVERLKVDPEKLIIAVKADT